MKNSTAMYYIVSAGRGVLYQLFPVEYNVYIFICIYKHVYEYAHSQVLSSLGPLWERFSFVPDLAPDHHSDECQCVRVLNPVLWIRIQIGSVFSNFADPDPHR